jgi:hypothetical protein
MIILQLQNMPRDPKSTRICIKYSNDVNTVRLRGWFYNNAMSTKSLFIVDVTAGELKIKKTGAVNDRRYR